MTDASSSASTGLDLFRCERQRSTMTRSGCTRMWLSAQAERPHPWEARHKCATCPIGAGHAGQTMSSVAEAVAALRLICPRCNRPSDRQIKGLICVGCYNRQLEAIKGVNGKGGKPRLKLRSERVIVIENGTARLAQHQHALNLIEIIIIEARHAAGPLAFARAKPVLPTAA
jgi:hypothetical protein